MMTINHVLNAAVANGVQPEAQPDGRLIYRLPLPSIPLPRGFDFVERWSNGFRQVFVNPETKSTVTFCEGDTTLAISPSDEVFEEELKASERFYQEF